MADKDDTSKAPQGRNSNPTQVSSPGSAGARSSGTRDVSAETRTKPETPGSPAAGDHKPSNPSALTRLERAIEAQREQLLQAHGVLTCLYEVLLHAEGDDAVSYAQAAHAAARLINKSAEDLDSVRIRPLIDELVFKSGYRAEEPAVLYFR